MVPDQIVNLLQDQVFSRHRKSHPERLRNKAGDVPVNPVPAARTRVNIHGHLNDVVRHTACIYPKYAIQDNGEVYDVAHHTSYVLLADVRETETDR